MPRLVLRLLAALAAGLAAAPALAPAPTPRRPIVVASTPVPNPPERPARKPAAGPVRRAPEAGDPAARVARANAAARVQPTGSAYANAAQIYPYAEGALFQVYTAPGRITDITLEEGETLSGTGPVAAGDTVRKKLGLRQLELVAQPDDIGMSFKFRVNGLDIFAKGANWIPHDALPARESRARLDGLLDSAVQAHMNMLRVWGGGQYESEAFYDLCDEKGLLVWQDMMFSDRKSTR